MFNTGLGFSQPGCMGSCHFGNFRCKKGRKCSQNDNISAAMNVIKWDETVIPIYQHRNMGKWWGILFQADKYWVFRNYIVKALCVVIINSFHSVFIWFFTIKTYHIMIWCEIHPWHDVLWTPLFSTTFNFSTFLIYWPLRGATVSKYWISNIRDRNRWAFPIELQSGECHKTLLVSRQHRFR